MRYASTITYFHAHYPAQNSFLSHTTAHHEPMHHMQKGERNFALYTHAHTHTHSDWDTTHIECVHDKEGVCMWVWVRDALERMREIDGAWKRKNSAHWYACSVFWLAHFNNNTKSMCATRWVLKKTWCFSNISHSQSSALWVRLLICKAAIRFSWVFHRHFPCVQEFVCNLCKCMCRI